MNTTPLCPSCGKRLAPNAPKGLCAECLLKAGFPTGTQPEGSASKFVPPSPEELAAHFPQLEIIELIGRGGMGAVYKARQKQLDRIVALKILPPGIGEQGGFAERFAREAMALARLNHPGIVTLYEFGQANGLFFFLMEFVDGVNLRQLLQGGRISSREALAIVPQICDALQYAHDQGIVHRDIKPENILMDRRGRVKVADFGLARLMGVEPESPATGESVASVTLTEAGKIMGTPQYMAPEQKERPTEVDHRADIYALGVVFYQMLTGELPDKRLEPPSKKVQVDVRLDQIVLRALEREPELRYQQASVLKTEVESMTDTGETSSPETQASSSAKEPKIKMWLARPFARRVLWILFAVCLLDFIWPHRAWIGNQADPVISIGATQPWFTHMPTTSSGQAATQNHINATRITSVNPGAGSFQSGVLGLLILIVLLWSKQKALRSELLRHRVRYPAWGLMIVALLLLLHTGFNLGSQKFFGKDGSIASIKSAWLFACYLVGRLAAAVIIAYSALQIRQLRQYSWAVGGPIIMLVTAVRLQGIWWIGVPFAAWALEILLRADVKNSFVEDKPTYGTKSGGSGTVRGAVAISLGATSGMLGMLTFAMSPNPPVWLVFSIPVAALAGIILAIPVRRTVSGGTALIIGSINLAIWLVIGAVFVSFETKPHGPATTNSHRQDHIPPNELAKFSTPKVIQAGIDDPTSAWPWLDLKKRVEDGRLNRAEIDELMQRLTSFMRTFPGGYRQPLSWLDQLLNQLDSQRLISEKQAADFLEALVGTPRFRGSLPRVREGDATLHLTCECRNTWVDDLFGLTIFNDLRSVTIDDQSVSVRDVQGRGSFMSYLVADAKLPALAPGKHTIRVEIDTAFIPKADLVGLDLSIPAKEWPPAKRRWIRIVQGEFTVYPKEAELVKLTTDPALNPSKQLAVKKLIIRSKDKGTRAVVVFAVGDIRVPISFNVVLRIDGKFSSSSGLWSDKPGGESHSVSGIELTLELEDRIDPRVTEADIILTPVPHAVEGVSTINEIWGEKIVFTKLPLTRQDIH